MVQYCFEIYRADHPKMTYLGDVLAENQPAALLAAFKQFDIKDNAKQREIIARKAR